MSLEPLATLESKEVLKKMMGQYKNPGVSLKGFHWLNLSNWSTKISKDSKELLTIQKIIQESTQICRLLNKQMEGGALLTVECRVSACKCGMLSWKIIIFQSSE